MTRKFRYCKQCKERLLYKRSDAIYCDTLCKSRYYNRVTEPLLKEKPIRIIIESQCLRCNKYFIRTRADKVFCNKACRRACGKTAARRRHGIQARDIAIKPDWTLEAYIEWLEKAS